MKKVKTSIMKACIELAAVVAAYSLVFLVPEALLPHAQAQLATALALPLLLVAVFFSLHFVGLWHFSGLSWTRAKGQRVLHIAAPYAIVLAVPVLNVVLGWQNILGVALDARVILICAAIMEEIMFRGLLMGIFAAHGLNPLANVVLTSAIFAGMHLFNTGTLPGAYVAVQFGIALFLGAAFGFARLSTNSLYPSIVAHVLVNATAASTASTTSTASAVLNNEGLLLTELVVAIVVGLWCFVWWKMHTGKAA